MGTVSGDFLYDFTGEADANPYTDAGLNVITGSFRTASGALKGNTSFSTLNTTATPTESIRIAKIQMNSGQPSGDPLGPALLDDSGNGYLLRCNFSETRIYIVNAGVLGARIGGATNGDANAGDDVWLEINEATGDITSYKNGVVVESINNGTYTGLKAGVYYSFLNNRNAGFSQFAGTGYAPAQSVTTTGPYKPADTITYSTTGLGTITSATLTDSSANVLTLTSVTDVTAVIPAFTTSGQQANLFGTVTLTVGDGTDTATTTFTLDPPTGYTAVTASGLTVPSTDPLDWNYAPTGGWTNEPADTDQLFHNDAFITYNADGSTTYTPGDLGTSYTAVYYLIDATDGKLTKVTKNYLDGVPASNTTQRGLSLSQSMRIGI